MRQSIGVLLFPIVLILLNPFDRHSHHSVQAQQPQPLVPSKPVARWTLVPEEGPRFFPRDSHQSTVFQSRIWVIGGYTETHYGSRLVETNARADVWSSFDGKTWDLVVQEAVFPARYGHTLTTFTLANGTEAMMVLGGFAPTPANDVWLTTTGLEWTNIHKSSGSGTGEEEKPNVFTPRAWHSTVVFANRIWVLGGTPLSNDIWSTSDPFVVASSSSSEPELEAERQTGWTWVLEPEAGPWSKRSAHACTTHVVFESVQIPATDNNNNDDPVAVGNTTTTTVATTTITTRVEYLFLVGGWNGETLNDVWRMDESGAWTELETSAPWTPRAWTSLVSFSSTVASDVELGPRMILIGGGRTGQGIELMLTMTDVWFSRNGTHWTQASVDQLGLSTADWCVIRVKNKIECKGKWGHSVVVFEREVGQAFACNETCVDYDKDIPRGQQLIPMADPQALVPAKPFYATIKEGQNYYNAEVFPDGCGTCDSPLNRYYAVTKIPALYLIAGESLSREGEGMKTRDVFSSDSGLACEKNGVLCSNAGTCTPVGGCYCNAGRTGEFCDERSSIEIIIVTEWCFPSHAKIQFANGSTSTIDRAQVGDRVLSMTDQGEIEYSEIYYVPHDSSHTSAHHYLKFNFNTNASLEVTPEHFVYVDEDSTIRALDDRKNVVRPLYRVMAAKDIHVGMNLIVYESSSNTWSRRAIESIEHTTERGALTLYTMNGRMIVNDVLCSNFGDFYSVPLSHPWIDDLSDEVPYLYFSTHRFLHYLMPSTLHQQNLAFLLRYWNDWIMIPFLKYLFR